MNEPQKHRALDLRAQAAQVTEAAETKASQWYQETWGSGGERDQRSHQVTKSLLDAGWGLFPTIQCLFGRPEHVGGRKGYTENPE